MSRARTLIKLCLVFIIVQSVSSEWKPNNKGTETLCKTAECAASGEEYKNNLNTKVNPCNDFFTFSCGNWQRNHPGSKYTPMWNILDLINFNFHNIIRNILESYNYQEGDDVSFRQAKTAYETCIKIPQYPISDANNIAGAVAMAGRVPKTAIWDIHTKYLQLSGESAFFQTRILGSRKLGNTPVLMLVEPRSAYGSIFHEENWKPQEKQAYTDFLFQIMKSLKLNDADAPIRKRIDKVFQFRRKLDRICEQNKKKKPDTYKPFVGQSLSTWFSRNLPQQTPIQDIPWMDVIDALMQSVPNRLTGRIIALRQKQYFLDLMELIKVTPEEILGSHMEIYFVERHLKLNEKMFKLLEGTSVEPHDLLRYIREKHDPRWLTCLKELNMKEELEKLVYQKWFRKDHAFLVRVLNAKIRRAIESQMEKSTWLDESTRQETMTKINNVIEWIGFPPWINGDEVATFYRNKNEILNPEASLAIDLNLLYIHAPLFLPPVFSPTMPTVYNYAGMGTTVGHELYHVIYDCGQYVVTGNVNVIWWHLAMRDECLKRKALFIDAFNKITDREFKNHYNMVVQSDTSVSVLENLPDVMGLEAAYNAYKELELKEKSVCQTLPNFEKYSCDQMFYIAFANTFCGYHTKKSAQKKLAKKSIHSLESIRVNGAVAQMNSFATAFGCPAGSPMNPRQKVNLWQ